MIPEGVQNWLEENGCGGLQSSRSVGGGCINNGMVLKMETGQTFFLKTNAHAPADMFAREAEGLNALRIDGGPTVPQPFLWAESFLLLEDLAPGAPGSGYWPDFGRRLARLHKQVAERFGFQHDNYIGSTPQPNPWTGDGYTFFGEQRLLYQARLSNRKGLLGRNEVSQVERLAARLPELVPAQPPSLIHGDLWSGNALPDSGGLPAVIDPAAHYGWAEAELAMTTLFGSFPPDFYAAYQEERPLNSGFRERFSIYNLYHLLNHLNLFGTGYLGSVLSILRRFAA